MLMKSLMRRRRRKRRKRPRNPRKAARNEVCAEAITV